MSGAAEAADRAVAFVRAHGNDLSRLRLDVVLGVAPAVTVRDALRERQRPDGSFGPLGGAAAAADALAATLEAVAVLDDLHELVGAETEAAVSWLVSQQETDGSWRRGEPCETRSVVLTGLIGGYLAKTPFASSAALESAGRFLGERWSPDRVSGGAYGPLVAFTHFFAITPHELGDAALQWCGRELERGYRTGAFEALRTVRVFTLCEAQSLPGGRLDAAQLVEPLLAEQAGDGGWRPGAPTRLRVEETLAALVGLTRLV